MSYSPFLIANERVGLERDIEPWLLPNDGFPDLEDCYMWRGRVKKRLGFNILGRLGRVVAVTTGAPQVINLPPFSAGTPITEFLSHFTIGPDEYQDPGGANPVFLLTTGTPGSAELDRVAGTLTLSGADGAGFDVIFFPGLPVMGLPLLETNIIDQELMMAFDTVFSYRYSNTSMSFIDTSLHKTTNTLVYWTGEDYQQFWSTNYLQALWATNNVEGFQNIPTTTVPGQGDGIRWFDQNQSGWVNFLPQVNGINFLMGALIILAYKGRLVMFNTVEGTSIGSFKRYYQRARWSQVGNPFYVAPLPTESQFGGPDVDGWRDDIPGHGGFIDATTLEQIVSAEYVKDTLIVYFERSTWQLIFTGNDLQPFLWEKINTELGAQSTFSVVPFDRTTIAVGDFGIHACDSVNVQRIDQKVPDEIFNIQNSNNGPERTSGIRDYFNQLVYWSFPYIQDETAPVDGLTYPNKIMVYNYVDGSFSFFNDSFTSFGYFQSANDLTWGGALSTWTSSNFQWISPITQAQFASIAGGNQVGFVEILMQKTTNDNSLFISNIAIGSPFTTLTIPNHNLLQFDPISSDVAGIQYIKITSASGITGLTGNIYPVTRVVDENTVTIPTEIAPTGTFTGAGLITPVNNISIFTKRFNPFTQEAVQVSLGYVDFYLDKTDKGQITVQLYINEDDSLPVLSDTVATYSETTYSKSPGKPASPDTAPYVQRKLWKRAYYSNVSQLFQMHITMSPEQMIDNAISSSDIVLHGTVLWFGKAGRLINV